MRAIRINPEYTEAWDNRGVMLLKLAKPLVKKKANNKKSIPQACRRN